LPHHRSRKHTDREAFLQEIGNRHYPVAPLRFYRMPFGVNPYRMNCMDGMARSSAIAYAILMKIFMAIWFKRNE
jgi:hypothetical protein